MDFVVVDRNKVESFLAELPISRLWGVGPKTAARLKPFGVHTIGGLAAIPRPRLVDKLGAVGDHLWLLARGRDERPVVSDWEPKSISNETTFEEDTSDTELLLGTLQRPLRQGRSPTAAPGVQGPNDHS